MCFKKNRGIHDSVRNKAMPTEHEIHCSGHFTPRRCLTASWRHLPLYPRVVILGTSLTTSSLCQRPLSLSHLDNSNEIIVVSGPTCGSSLVPSTSTGEDPRLLDWAPHEAILSFQCRISYSPKAELTCSSRRSTFEKPGGRQGGVSCSTGWVTVTCVTVPVGSALCLEVVFWAIVSKTLEKRMKR